MSGKILGELGSRFVRFGALSYTVHDLPSVLRRYVEPALFISPGCEPYGLTKSGSLSKITRMGKRFALVCAHQFGSDAEVYKNDQLVLVDYAGTAVSSHAVHGFAAGSLEDIRIYEFTQAVESWGNQEAYWLARSSWNCHGLEPVLAFAIGYPSHRNSIDYETQKYGAAPSCAWGEPSEPSMPERLSMVVNPALDYDPVGFSGGAVFGIHQTETICECKFEGIITNASRSVLNFAPAFLLSRVLDQL